MNIFKKSLVALSALSIASLGFAAPASAAVGTVGVYGVWSTPTFDAGTFSWSGDITFTDAHVTHATYKVTYLENIDGDNYAEETSPNSKGDWITDEVDMGKAFGANGPADDNTLLVTGVASDAQDPNYTVEITFDDEVPAGELGFTAIDLDVDSATVTMKDGSNNALTGAQIQGGATNMAYNICAPVATSAPTNCGSETTTPVATTNANDVNWAEVDEDQGVAAWVKPNAGVKTITAAVTGSNGGSSLRWILAVTGDLPDSAVEKAYSSGLANTGTDGVLPGLALLTAGAVAVATARRLRKN